MRTLGAAKTTARLRKVRRKRASRKDILIKTDDSKSEVYTYYIHMYMQKNYILNVYRDVGIAM